MKNEERKKTTGGSKFFMFHFPFFMKIATFVRRKT